MFFFWYKSSFLLTLELMLNMGYTRQAVEDSITHQKYDDVQATYLLLGRRTSDVSQARHPGECILKCRMRIF